jgi:hypothetical protein
MRKAIIIVFTCSMFAGVAAAQVPASGNVFVGYSFESAGSSTLNLDLSRANLQGWEASLEGKLFPALGIVADFSGHYGSQSFQIPTPNGLENVTVNGHEDEVLFGPRISVPVGKFRPFGEFEVGIGHVNNNSGFGSDTAFATAVGGGLDYRIIRPVAWRFQGDYVRTQFFHSTQNNVRLSTGIVFRF